LPATLEWSRAVPTLSRILCLVDFSENAAHAFY
jgi:hypothetical protein